MDTSRSRGRPRHHRAARRGTPRWPRGRVVVRHGRWFLLCWAQAAGAVRTYRVDRTHDVALLDAHRPAGRLDPVVLPEMDPGAGWEHADEVLVEAAVEDVTRWLPHTLGRPAPVGGGRTRVVGSTSNPSGYAQQLLLLPAPFRVARRPLGAGD